MVFILDAEYGFEVCFSPTETDYISWLQEEEMLALAFAFQRMRQIFFYIFLKKDTCTVCLNVWIFNRIWINIDFKYKTWCIILHVCYIFQMSNCCFLFRTKKWVYQNLNKSVHIELTRKHLHWSRTDPHRYWVAFKIVVAR